MRAPFHRIVRIVRDAGYDIIARSDDMLTPVEHRLIGLADQLHSDRVSLAQMSGGRPPRGVLVADRPRLEAAVKAGEQQLLALAAAASGTGCQRVVEVWPSEGCGEFMAQPDTYPCDHPAAVIVESVDEYYAALTNSDGHAAERLCGGHAAESRTRPDPYERILAQTPLVDAPVPAEARSA